MAVSSHDCIKHLSEDVLPVFLQRQPFQSRQKVKSEVDRKSTRLNSSHLGISYAVFCLKKKKSAIVVGPSYPPALRSVGDRVLPLLRRRFGPHRRRVEHVVLVFRVVWASQRIHRLRVSL